jgi:hypothetical protein
MTVESMFSMNRAVATMSGIRRSLFIEFCGRGQERVGSRAVASRCRTSYCGTRRHPKILRDPLRRAIAVAKPSSLSLYAIIHLI